MSSDFIDYLSKSTGDYIHNLSTYKSVKINDINKFQTKYSYNDNFSIKYENENYQKLNNENRSIFDLLKNRKGSNSKMKHNNTHEKDKDIPENQSSIKHNINKFNSRKNKTNYSPSEIDPQIITNKNSNIKDNHSSIINRNLSGNKDHKNKNLSNNNNKNFNNTKYKNGDKEIHNTYERLKNFDSLQELLNKNSHNSLNEGEETEQRWNYHDIKKKIINPSSTINNKNTSLDFITSQNERKKNEHIEKLNKELEKNEIKLLGKKMKNTSTKQIEISKDFIPGTEWCHKCKGYHDPDAHKKIFKKPLPVSIKNEPEKNQNNSNEKKIEKLENILKKKNFLEDVNDKNNTFNKIQFNNSSSCSLVSDPTNLNKRNEIFDNGLIKKKKLNSESKESYDDTEIKKINRDNLLNSKPNLEKIKNIINENNNYNKICNFSHSKNPIKSQISEKENYIEEFEDIDYELENNNDYEPNIEKNIEINSFHNRNKIQISEKNKIDYSPCENIIKEEDDCLKIQNIGNIKQNNKETNTINRFLPKKETKIDYSPSQNFNISNNDNKHDSLNFYNDSLSNANILSYNSEFDDIKINKIRTKSFNSYENDSTTNNYDKNLIKADKVENKDASLLKLAKIKEVIKPLNPYIKIKSKISENNIYGNIEKNMYDKSSKEDQIILNGKPIKKNFPNNTAITVSSKFRNGDLENNQKLFSEIKNNINLKSKPNLSEKSDKILNDLKKPNHNKQGPYIVQSRNVENHKLKTNNLQPSSNSVFPKTLQNKNNQQNMNNEMIKNNPNNNNQNIKDIKGFQNISRIQNNNNKMLNKQNYDVQKIPQVIKQEYMKNQNNISFNNFNKNSNDYNKLNSKNGNLIDKININSQITKINPHHQNPYEKFKLQNQVHKKIKRRYRDESDRKFAELFDTQEMKNFICDEEENDQQHRKYLDSINKKLSRGNNVHLIQDYSEDSLPEADFEIIEKEENYTAWIGAKEDEEEEKKQEMEREKRRMKKIMKKKNDIGEDEEIGDSENDYENK